MDQGTSQTVGKGETGDGRTDQREAGERTG